MIRTTCPGCKSNLTAKGKLAGQTRKCPKCGTPVLIPAPDLAAEPSPKEEASVRGPGPATLLALDVPNRLQRTSRYLICSTASFAAGGTAKLVAAWQDNGQGWMLKTNAGFISAKRNRDLLPPRGNFQLVELTFSTTDAGPRLAAVMVYQLARNWALTTLDKGDHEILSMVTGPGRLSKEQKNVVRQAIKDRLMHSVWADAREVLDYLANTDYHSPGTQ